jgi:aspartate kinase
MPIIVQKFGGTSVADAAKIKAAARRIVAAKQQGYDVLAVVSAMGHATDELYDLAYQVSPDPPQRELDMLVTTGEQVSIALVAIAIHAMGLPVVSLLGDQIGIITDTTHGKARIKSVHTERILAEFARGRIVIVAGFQGVTEDDDITTLGRGGSDTTAVAIAAALKADKCEIYTDVDGVYTADPRIVPTARKLDAICHDEMLELASMGAGVLHSRSVEFAKKYNVPLVVRSSFSDDPGTVVCKEVPGMEGVLVRGAALSRNEAKVTILGVPDRPGIAAHIMQEISNSSINLDVIVQNVSHEGRTDFTFTVARTDLKPALAVCSKIVEDIGADGVSADDTIAKLSVVGVGMRSHSGVAAKMFRALAAQKINIQLISTSEIKISCVIGQDRADDALRAVHDVFGLGSEDTDV